jgi:PmbA protein
MNQQIQQHNGYGQLAMDLLAKAKREGATEADIIIADGENFSVQVRLGAVDRLTKARENAPPVPPPPISQRIP